MAVFVTWFSRAEDEQVGVHLVEAARRYNDERFDALIVPANIAAEVAVGRALSKVLRPFGSVEHVGRFLQDGATYSHQLNVLLNVAASVVGVARLPDTIRGLLNRLRKLRNDVAHEGGCAAQSRKDAAEHLAAAIFGVHYAKLLDRMADAATARGPILPTVPKAGSAEGS